MTDDEKQKIAALMSITRHPWSFAHNFLNNIKDKEALSNAERRALRRLWNSDKHLIKDRSDAQE